LPLRPAANAVIPAAITPTAIRIQAHAGNPPPPLPEVVVVAVGVVTCTLTDVEFVVELVTVLAGVVTGVVTVLVSVVTGWVVVVIVVVVVPPVEVVPVTWAIAVDAAWVACEITLLTPLELHALTANAATKPAISATAHRGDRRRACDFTP